MRFQCALIKEQGQSFAIVIVKPHVLQSHSSINDARNAFSRFFPGVPIILMAYISNSVPTFQGREDIVRFLVKVPTSTIPWKEFTAA